MSLTVRPVGRSAHLIEFDVPAEQRRGVRAWIARKVAGADVLDVVPAARTVLVRYLDSASCQAALPALCELCAQELPTDAVDEAGEDRDVLIVPVRYDGKDLAEVAKVLGVSVEEVVRRHQAAEWIVEFTGFTAGFGYLSQANTPNLNLTVPRRDTPRKRIPKGAVALADAFTGVYPTASPGGWQLIGTTELEMFNQRREPSALLTPGGRVRFVADEACRAGAWAEVSEGIDVGDGEVEQAPALLVEAVGPQALIEDLGRVGQLSTGLSTSGAADRPALRLANRIVGNVEGAPGIEVTFGGLSVRALQPAVVSVTGAIVELVRERGGAQTAVDTNTPILLEAGDLLRLPVPRAGLRNYLAMAGGFAVTQVAGSASSDPTAGIGPRPLRAGDRLWAGSAWSGLAALTEHRAAAHILGPEPTVLRATWGPRAAWFTAQARQTLSSSTYRVAAESDRVGVRLEGPPLHRDVVRELPSEPLIRGCVQVPADGQPLMFFADHPTTGGYPVIAVVDDEDTDLLAQARPGSQVRFTIRGEIGRR